MAKDYMLCDTDMVFDASKEMKKSKEICDRIMDISSRVVEGLVDYDWHGEESEQFYKEYDELKDIYKSLTDAMIELSKNMYDFSDDVEQFDLKYSRVFSSI